MIENIGQARIEFYRMLGFCDLNRVQLKKYILLNEDIFRVFEKHHLPKRALQARLRIQAALEYLNGW